MVLYDESLTLTATATGSGTLTWSDSTGRDTSVSFPNGNTGTSVGWKAPGNAGNVTVTATCCAESDHITITVAAVQLESVTFGGLSHHTLYKKDAGEWTWAAEDYATDYDTAVPDKAWTSSLQDPVCYTKSSTGSDCTRTVELSINPPLTHYVGVIVKAVDYENDFFAISTSITGDSVTLGPMYSIMTWYSGKIGCFELMESWCITTDGGTNYRGIGLSQNPAYSTWGTPSGSQVTAKRIDFVCTAAEGANTAKEVADGIQAALDANPPNDGSGGTQTDTWALLDGSPYEGECDEQARFMVQALELIGSSGTAYNTYASTDTSVTSYESKVQDGKTWFLKFDFDDDGTIDNKFEGSVSSAGHYYAVWPSLDASSECNLLRQVGPGSFGATQRWGRTDDGTFWGSTVEQLPGTESYPSCP